ncbi:MAG: ATP cone domain-containing protein [Planctomycetota bacterium]|nr:ATP cone domain-containing protein [Planctomycetota bacterium]MCX8039742.1 ATP cone domain-containing protein [Planctomycetota bacterium]MDW8373232.1 ATP cone domain-containing protein [Planctomycetota bacterium]
MKPQRVVKRDGSEVPFDPERIARAIARALAATGVRDDGLSAELAGVVVEHLERTLDGERVALEEVQDAVVHVLQESGHYEVAIAYARYRDARERARRERRARGERQVPIHLAIVEPDGRRRSWDAAWLSARLRAAYRLNAAQVADAIAIMEELVAASPLTELPLSLVDALGEAALVRLGLLTVAQEGGVVRVPRAALHETLAAGDGAAALCEAGRLAWRHAAAHQLPPAVARAWSRGRLWVDGIDDPLRGSQLTVVFEALGNPWQVLAQAAARAIEGGRDYRRLRLVMPPAILGHLERGAQPMAELVASISQIAQVFLYCDGRTPLLQRWPFAAGRVGLAIYNDDFLLAQHTANAGIPLIAGAQYARGGWKHAVAVEVALNAQGLEQEWSQLDLLAMAAATAAAARRERLPARLRDDDLRFAVFGLAVGSPSSDYLEQQVIQEGLRLGLRFTRATSLPPEACRHLGRLLEA